MHRGKASDTFLHHFPEGSIGSLAPMHVEDSIGSLAPMHVECLDLSWENDGGKLSLLICMYCVYEEVCLVSGHTKT